MAVVAGADVRQPSRRTLAAVVAGLVMDAGLVVVALGVTVVAVAAATTAHTLTSVPVAGTPAAAVPGPGVRDGRLGVLEPHALEAVLARADVWALLLAGGAAAVALAPVVRAWTAGRGVRHGQAARLAVAAGAVATGWVAAAALPMLAAARVIAADDSLAGLEPAFAPSVWPLVVVVALALAGSAVGAAEQRA